MSRSTSEWTIGKRVASGFAVGLGLVVVVTIVAVWALGRTLGTYEAALEQRRELLFPAQRVESEIRGANVEFLRYLVEGEAKYAAAADSTIRAARQTAEQVRVAAGSDLRTAADWGQLTTLLDQWALEIDSSMAARKAGNEALALSIRADRIEPLGDRLNAIVVTTTDNVVSRSATIAADAAATS